MQANTLAEYIDSQLPKGIPRELLVGFGIPRKLPNPVKFKQTEMDGVWENENVWTS